MYLKSLGVNRETNPQFNNANITTLKNTYNLSKKNTIRFGKNGFWQNNTKIENLIENYGEFVGEYSIFLLNCNTANTKSNIGCKAKIYSCKIYNNGILVRNFIPVLDKSNVPCFYDKVEQKYYYNKGTGEFLYKPKEI